MHSFTEFTEFTAMAGDTGVVVTCDGSWNSPGRQQTHLVNCLSWANEPLNHWTDWQTNTRSINHWSSKWTSLNSRKEWHRTWLAQPRWQERRHETKGGKKDKRRQCRMSDLPTLQNDSHPKFYFVFIQKQWTKRRVGPTHTTSTAILSWHFTLRSSPLYSIEVRYLEETLNNHIWPVYFMISKSIIFTFDELDDARSPFYVPWVGESENAKYIFMYWRKT